MLKRAHRAGIDVEVGIELLERHLESAIFEQRAQRAAVRPLPSELTTPPVTKINFISNSF